MRLLIDMNLTPRWVPFLQNAGHEAVHWSTIGSRSAKDSEICDHAREYGFVLLTNDLDFPQILAHTKGAAPSVMLLRGEPLVPEARGSALLGALKDCDVELNLGALLRSIGQTSRVQECCRSDRFRRVHLHLVLTELRTPW